MTSMPDPALDREIRNLGNAIDPQIIAQCLEIYGRSLPDPAGVGCRVDRDLSYGAHPRHRLDIFGGGHSTGRPVLVYVHGGGFVGGDKVLPGTPFYDNIGIWAAQQGFVGVTMTHRLAPAAPWPAGAEDVAAALAWLRSNIADYGGSPDAIFIAGQSAGATHVASYLAMGELHDTPRPVAGAIMFSGIYDVTSLTKGPLEQSYFGPDDSLAERQSALSGLVASELPMLFTVAEFDPPVFQQQAVLLVERWFQAKRSMPRLLFLPRANHMTAALSVGGADRTLAPQIRAFVEQVIEGRN